MDKKKKLMDALRLSQEFCRRAEVALESNEYSKDSMGSYGGKFTASAKRASMDLSRALADLRKY